NEIFAEPTAVASNYGVLMVSVQNTVSPTFTNNTITGADYGIGLTNTSTSNTITLGPTNSIVGSKLAGVYLTDNLAVNPVNGTNLSETAGPYFDPIAVHVSGMSITAASGVGVRVEALRTVNANVATTASIDNGTSISGIGSTGVSVAGALAAASLTNTAIGGLTTGIDNSGGTLTIGSGDTITG